MTPERDGAARLRTGEALLTAALVAAAAALAFAPSLRGAILDYDDRLFLLPSRIAPAWDVLRDVLTRPYIGNYVPLASLSFMLDSLVWGGSAWGYHLTNVAFHAANAGLLFALLLELLGAGTPRREDAAAAAFGALFFALHPLRVQSVAWIAERRDVLCGFFCLISLLCWARSSRAAPREAFRLRAATFFSFVLALLSKSAAAPLPFAFIILDALRSGRLKLSRSLLPFFALSAAAGVVTVLAQRDIGALAAVVTPGERILQAIAGLGFYLGKTLWPANLAFYERRWELVVPAALVGGAAAAALALAAWRAPRLRVPFAAALAFYAFMLAPTLGAIAYGHELAADRYSYLPSFALAALAALAFRALARSRPRASAAAGLILLSALSIAAVRQTAVWRDETSLWRSVLRADPLSWAARGNLAKALLDTGRDGEALLILEEHLSLYPDSPKARFERDKIAARLGDGPEVHARIHAELGREFAAEGEYAKAAWHYRKAEEALSVKTAGDAAR